MKLAMTEKGRGRDNKMAEGAGNPLMGGMGGEAPPEPDEGALRMGASPGGNALGGAPGGPAQSPGPQGSPQTAASGGPWLQHEALEAQYKSMEKSEHILQTTRMALDEVMKMADTVTPADVVSAAKKIVATGVAPSAMAKILADPSDPLPESGPAIQAWVANHDATIRQKEAQLEAMISDMRFQLGYSGMKMMALGGMAQGIQEKAMAAQETSGGAGPPAGNSAMPMPNAGEPT